MKRYLVALVENQGDMRIQLIDLKRKKIIFLPGVNINNSIPISVSISSNAEKLAFIRQQNGVNKVLIFYRKSGIIRRVDLSPEAIPIKLNISASGKMLAVQVLKNERNVIDIIKIDS